MKSHCFSSRCAMEELLEALRMPYRLCPVFRQSSVSPSKLSTQLCSFMFLSQSHLSAICTPSRLNFIHCYDLALEPSSVKVPRLQQHHCCNCSGTPFWLHMNPLLWHGMYTVCIALKWRREAVPLPSRWQEVWMFSGHFHPSGENQVTRWRSQLRQQRVFQSHAPCLADPAV